MEYIHPIYTGIDCATSFPYKGFLQLKITRLCVTRREEERVKVEKEKKEMAISTALKLKRNNVGMELIADATGLSVEEIQAL